MRFSSAVIGLALLGCHQRASVLQFTSNSKPFRVSYMKTAEPALCELTGSFAGELVAPLADFLVREVLKGPEDQWTVHIVGGRLGPREEVTVAAMGGKRSISIDPMFPAGMIVTESAAGDIRGFCYSAREDTDSIKIDISPSLEAIE